MCRTLNAFIGHLKILVSKGAAEQLRKLVDAEIKEAEKRGAKWMRDLVVAELDKDYQALHDSRPQMNEWFAIYQTGGRERDELIKRDEVMSDLELRRILVDSYPLCQEDKDSLDQMIAYEIAKRGA